MSIQLIEFVSLGTLLKVELLDLVSPLPEQLRILVLSILPKRIEEPDSLKDKDRKIRKGQIKYSIHSSKIKIRKREASASMVHH